jgi:hypothetical protein
MNTTAFSKSITTVALALVIVMFLGGVVVGLAMIFASYWPDPSSSMPAWIQAVGSIAAILVSVGIIAWDHGRQREAQLDSEKAELANLVLATYMFGSAISSVVHTFASSEGRKGIAPMSAVDFCLNRIRRVLEQNSQMPHWKLDAKTALVWSVMHKLARAIEGSLEVVKRENGDSNMAITAGISDSSGDWQRGLAKTVIDAREHYEALTKTEIPEVF